MNLYCVYPYPRGGNWCCYVFEETRNKARTRLVGYFDNNDTYVDFGATLVAKDTGGDAQVCDTNCDRLERLGVKYQEDEDEEEAWHTSQRLPPPTTDEIFTIKARRCKRCGGLLTSKQAVEDGYGHVCKMKALQEEAARKPIDGQMTLLDLGGEA